MLLKHYSNGSTQNNVLGNESKQDCSINYLTLNKSSFYSMKSALIQMTDEQHGKGPTVQLFIIKDHCKKANGHLEQKEAVDFPQGSRMDS